MLRFLVLYTALALGANVAQAADLDAVKSGQMESLVTYDEPLPLPPFTVTDESGDEHSMKDFEGKVVLINFWATWCPPCREEMPSLNALQKAYGENGFQVMTIATGGSNSPEKVAAFFDKEGIDALPRFHDDANFAARAMGVLGLPVSVLVDKKGHEVGRMIGGAEWDSPEAKKVIEALIDEK
ncbi:TlpA disulfide reductase family protein [Thioclava sp. JE_KL1]|uniref:TlpA family protein disulfide reductase n=1 Tax=Thioclava sp. JE_KL1 TaxID=2651187 RepID=UPI00128C13AD|nr:TlpA disulfide reductase family protein [Thioclava sp. JE_KL1]MPQ92846.1 TlpA family protein disulfide reductase [Thioclava sp. JE_KL1]